MKTMKILGMILGLFFFLTPSFGQKSESSSGFAVIQTSAECGQCKDRLEETLNYTAGIRYAELNLEDMKLEVKFNPKKISLTEIKEIISKTGYDADEVKAVPSAVEQLPACCKPGGMDH